MKQWRLAVWLVGAGLMAAPQAWAQKPKWHDRPAATQRQTREHDFVARVHFNNQQQIRLGQLAMERGTTPSVRKLGEALARNYQALDEQLLRIAAQLGIALTEPQGVGGAGPDEERAKLTELSGEDFDRAFLVNVVQDAHVIRKQAMQDLRPVQLTDLQTGMLKLNNEHARSAESQLTQRFGDVTPPPPGQNP